MAFILVIFSVIGRNEAVDGGLGRNRDYFITVDLPLYWGCLSCHHKFLIVNKHDGDVDISYNLVVHNDPRSLRDEWK